ncbi:MarR family transcriptional regulator [Iamia sp. SCSIO 61187]|uniref:MarR family winged helix-turn-helix transcriptional regulator n=1 Tax=Iamia sp. SCSIO 61187 TaxID=2722752 RepID=UPI001C627512|nr:MarR family transcriptional regulator [Iamia sp. SCSIO 61187]QYG95047.1 MarR family transcriptional regulator [Iamia sp. SCSIO 61187]
MAPPPDSVDEMIAAWQRERPDLDLAAMGTIGRLGRLHAIGGRRIEEGMATHGLSVADFDVLAALRRSGAPHELTPTDLSRTLMLSPAGMTSRLDRLERAGLVERRMAPGDRRSVLVRLTEAGFATVDEAVTGHVAREEEILDGLSARERAQLDALLRKLLRALEP